MRPIIKENFSILFNENGYLELADFILKKNYQNILFLTDANTEKYCLKSFKKSICNINSKVSKIIDSNSFYYSLPHGESSKNINESIKVWDFLIQNGFKRNSLIINLGGGMVTDIGGFISSTFMRGIDFVNVPTTLLGMVDASIGGKTGIDFKNLKNIIGKFEFAKIILIDDSFLETLNEQQIISGFAEMIKHALIDSPNHWNTIREIQSLKNISKDMIYNSILTKVKIIEKDPTEKDIRKYLNYGHTLGHAIESYLLGTKRELLHGEAISVGIILESYLSCLRCKFDINKVNQIKSFVMKFYKKIDFAATDIEMVIKLLKYDKKNINDDALFVLIRNIGDPTTNNEVNIKEIKEAFRFYQD